GSMGDNAAVHKVNRVEVMRPVDGGGGAIDQDILAFVGCIAFGYGYCAGKDDVRVDVNKGCIEPVGNRLAVDAVLVLIHQIAGKVSDFWPDQYLIIAARAECREGNPEAICCERLNPRGRNDAV